MLIDLGLFNLVGLAFLLYEIELLLVLLQLHAQRKIIHPNLNIPKHMLFLLPPNPRPLPLLTLHQRLAINKLKIRATINLNQQLLNLQLLNKEGTCLTELGREELLLDETLLVLFLLGQEIGVFLEGLGGHLDLAVRVGLGLGGGCLAGVHYLRLLVLFLEG